MAALVKYEGRYIIARNVSWPGGIYSVITGYLEAGEEVEEAVTREVLEELGLKAAVTRYLGHHMFREKNQLILAFEVEGTGELDLNSELADAKLLRADELVEYDFHPLYITQAIISNWKTANRAITG